MPFIRPQFKRIARFSPLIGVLIGLAQGIILISLSSLNWPYESLPFIAIALNILLTGGLHFDGLIDTADGISAGSERCFEAMKDSRVGAIGLLSLIIILFLQIAALFKLRLFYLLVLPIAYFWGRYSQLWSIGKYPYRERDGSSKFHKKNLKGIIIDSIPSILVIFIFISFASLNIEFLLRLRLLIGTIIGIIPAILIPKLLANRLKKLSGDSYGATVILVETFMLLIFAIIL